MSVCMSLLKPVDATYLGDIYDNIRHYEWNDTDENGISTLEKKLALAGAPMGVNGRFPDHDDPNFDAFFKWEDGQKARAWSDGQEHRMIVQEEISSFYKNHRGKNEQLKRFKSLKPKYFDNGVVRKHYVAADEIAYAQGWYFKNKFLNRKATYYLATTKAQMIAFFDRYLDNSTDARMAVDAFTDSWEDGMIFVCSF